MNVRGFYRDICSIINISWLSTLLFNFRHLTLHKAVKLPILLYHPHIGFKGSLLGGRVEINTNKLRFLQTLKELRTEHIGKECYASRCS